MWWRHGKIGWALGGLMGLGGRTRVAEGMKRVERKFREGDYVIDVIGFSRGAAIALHFVNELAELGMLPGREGQPVAPRIRFLGLWDIVAAFGIPKDLGLLKFQKINLGWKLSLPLIVHHCYHAMALDERRESFRVTRVDRAYEVWFRGVHSDVGGSNANLPLNDIPLRWMLIKAQAVGVKIDTAILAQLGGDATAPWATTPTPSPTRSARSCRTISSTTPSPSATNRSAARTSPRPARSKPRLAKPSRRSLFDKTRPDGRPSRSPVGSFAVV